MTVRSELLFEYEQVLCGKKNFSTYYFPKNTKASEKVALTVIRHAIENVLGWKPHEALSHFTYEVALKLRLEDVIKYIDFPSELDEKTDMFYVVHLLYPKIITYNKRDAIIRTYKKVLNKELHKFPKEFFDGAHGMERASVCLLYMIQQYMPFEKITDIYELFSTSKVLHELKKYRLSTVCKEKFEHPVDYLHESLPESQKDELWYQFYRFSLMNSKQIRAMKREGNFIG